ncbi:MAG: hypothetical protein R2715_14240 [Ilumatobacteraceae bacterium]
MDDGYVSRIFNVLTGELMIERAATSATVDWEKIVGQITDGYTDSCPRTRRRRGLQWKVRAVPPRPGNEATEATPWRSPCVD